MQSENDVVAAERSVVYVRSCVSRLRWSPSLRWRAVFKVPCLLWDASVGEEMPCEWYAVAVMRRSAIVGHVPRKISAICSLFLADQLPARYFWQIRDYSIMSACARASSSFATRPRPQHVMTNYWRNLIWRCVHNPPNSQIKFSAKFPAIR